MYYVIIAGGKIVDASENLYYVKWQERNRIFIDCDEQSADAVITSNGECAYLLPGKQIDGYTVCEIREVSEEEYRRIREELDEEGEAPVPDDPEPAPDEPKTRIQILEEQLAQQTETIAFLTDCLLEMSEAVYG